MKIPFDIKFRPQIESGKYKVITSDGRPARVICWDRKFGLPIVALAYNKEDDREVYVNVNLLGKAEFGGDDLLLVEETHELTEFEQEFDAVFRSYCCEEFEGGYSAWVKERSAKLLALARKEIEKTLPKWTCANEERQFVRDCIVVDKENGRKVQRNIIRKGEYYIPLLDLESLPRNED